MAKGGGAAASAAAGRPTGPVYDSEKYWLLEHTEPKTAPPPEREPMATGEDASGSNTASSSDSAATAATIGTSPSLVLLQPSDTQSAAQLTIAPAAAVAVGQPPGGPVVTAGVQESPGAAQVVPDPVTTEAGPAAGGRRRLQQSVPRQDVLVAYTSTAASQAGSETALYQSVVANVARANKAYADTKINLALYLVGFKLVSADRCGMAATNSCRAGWHSTSSGSWLCSWFGSLSS